MDELIFSVITGFSIGFLGSFHCIGMCGPIAMALPVQAKGGWHKFFGIFNYNIGRALTYSFLGLFFGWMGQQFRFWGFQQAVSIGAGILILLFLLSNYSFASRVPWLYKMNNWVRRQLGGLLSSPKSNSSLLSIGLLNGLLPCGLVYVAIATSLATADMVEGATLMFAFGLGTIPVMAGLMFFRNLISINFRQKLNRAVPVLVGTMAILLILRGMNLGVSILSPKMDRETSAIECCHKPS